MCTSLGLIQFLQTAAFELYSLLLMGVLWMMYITAAARQSYNIQCESLQAAVLCCRLSYMLQGLHYCGTTPTGMLPEQPLCLLLSC